MKVRLTRVTGFAFPNLWPCLFLSILISIGWPKATKSTLLKGHKWNLSAVKDVVEEMDMLLTNVAQSSPGLISEKSDLWRSTASIRNLVQTGLKTAKMMRVKNLYSLPMGTLPSQRINKQRIKMIVDTGSKYEIISSELFKTHSKNYEPSQTQNCFTDRVNGGSNYDSLWGAAFSWRELSLADWCVLPLVYTAVPGGPCLPCSRCYHSLYHQAFVLLLLFGAVECITSGKWGTVGRKVLLTCGP